MVFVEVLKMIEFRLLFFIWGQIKEIFHFHVILGVFRIGSR
jgi:hypothetical protein